MPGQVTARWLSWCGSNWRIFSLRWPLVYLDNQGGPQAGGVLQALCTVRLVAAQAAQRRQPQAEITGGVRVTEAACMR